MLTEPPSNLLRLNGISLWEREAILAQIIEIKVSQSKLMLILELVQGSQTIRCLGFRAVKM